MPRRRTKEPRELTPFELENKQQAENLWTHLRLRGRNPQWVLDDYPGDYLMQIYILSALLYD